MYREVEKSSLYCLGIEESELTKLFQAKPNVYAEFFNPGHVDYLEPPGERKIVLIQESAVPTIKAGNYPTREDYLNAAIREMENHGVPQGTVHVYRQTLITERLD